MSDDPIVFERGTWWLGVFLVALFAQAIATNAIANIWELGADVTLLGFNALAVLLKVAFLAVIWWFIHEDGIALAEIGLATSLLAPALVTVAGFYLLLNVVVIGLGLLVADSTVLGYQWTLPPLEVLGWFGMQLAIAAIGEELAFRGYIQSKVIALVGSQTRVAIGLGILVQSVLFVALHGPRVVVSGIPGTQALAAYGGILFLSAVGYGVVYELTQNLYIPILIHAAGNMPGTIGITFFDLGAFPAWMSIAYPLLYLALFAVVIVGYRRWALETGQFPVWSHRRSHGTTSVM